MPSGAAFEFVVVSQQGQTVKEREQQQSVARSHAAKVSHRSRKRPKSIPKRLQSGVAPETETETEPSQRPVTKCEADLSIAPLPTSRSGISDTEDDSSATNSDEGSWGGHP